MNILGIDPGSNICGYAVISKEKTKLNVLKAGKIVLRASTFQRKILEFTESLDQELYGIEIHGAAMEDIFYAFNPKSVIKLAQFRGAISLKLLQDYGHFFEYTPLQVKKAITGNGKATKDQVAFIVKRILNIVNLKDKNDVTDAMAVAITYLNSKNNLSLIKSLHF